jgi:hypothetical protein
MSHDEGYHRFFAYLNLFVFAMLNLILGDSLVLLFVGWEGVGLCSYLLIGFWFTNADYAFAGQEGVHREPHRRRGAHPRDGDPRVEGRELRASTTRDEPREGSNAMLRSRRCTPRPTSGSSSPTPRRRERQLRSW